MATQSTILATDLGSEAFLDKINVDLEYLFEIADEVEDARDGETVLADQIEAIQNSILALVAGGGVLVSSDDTTVGYLNGKLVGDDDILLTEGSGGANETLTVSIKDSNKLADIESLSFFYATAF